MNSRNLPASVHQRLLNLSKEKGEEPNQVFLRYAIERFLYRLSQSPFGSNFILKGALLFFAWTGSAHRITRDLDLLGYGDASRDQKLIQERYVLATVTKAGLVEVLAENSTCDFPGGKYGGK